MSKINKLGKSTFVIAILSFLLVAVLAFGGTYAFFSASVEAKTDTITMGSLEVDLSGVEQDKIFVEGVAQPNQYIIGSSTDAQEVSIDLTTTINAFVRVAVNTTIKDAEGNDLFPTADTEVNGLTKDEVVVFANLENWVYYNGYYYYCTATDATSASNATATMDDVTIALQAYVNKLVGANESKDLMGAEISIEISAAAVQADYLKSQDTAATTITVADLHTAWATIVDSTYGD